MEAIFPQNVETQFTYDVFDTAICRLVHSPEHVHLLVGRKLRRQGLIDLSDSDWMYARAQAEYQQRRVVAHKEVTLDDIYLLLSRWLNLNQHDSRIAMETEWNEEVRLVRPIFPTRSAVFKAIERGNLPIFLSDTYFTSAQVELLLTQCGYSKPFDIITSCEQQKSKILGTLFDHVAEQRKLPRSCFSHLGDNSLSDLQNALASGWKAKLFTGSHWSTRDRVLFSSGKGDFLSSVIAGSSRAARLAQDTPVNNGILTAAASVVGPLFAAYVLWILLDVIARGQRTVYFLARDGQTLVPICQRLARWLGVEIDARYTLASRQAFLLPALPEDGDSIVDQALALAYYDHISLLEALLSLKFSDAEIAFIELAADIGGKQTSSELTREQKAALRDTLLRPEIFDSLRARSRAARAATMAYLESEGMLSADEACIVDLGWRGNTQLRLQRLLAGRVTLVGYYMGLSNSVLGPEDKTRVWTTATPWKTGLLEVMAAADHTSVKGFGFAEDGTPVCMPPIKEDAALVQWGAREQQKIALRFVEYFTDAVDLNQFSVEEAYAALNSAALESYRHFYIAPTFAEAEAYGGIEHQVDVNHLKSQELARPVDGIGLIRILLDKRARGEVTSWFTGSLARSKGSLMPRIISDGLDRTINLIARVQTRRRRKAADRHGERALENVRKQTA